MSLGKTMKLGWVGTLLLVPVAAMAQASAAAPAQITTQPSPASNGQTTSTSTGAAVVSTGGTKVHGTITDPDGELIPGATITLTPSKGSARTVKSGSDGTYAVTVTPGTYTVLVSMPGFASYVMTNLKIPAVPSTTVDAKLQIGVQDTVVNVEANAIQLSVDPDSNQSSTILSGKDLEALSDDPDELSSELTALAGPSAGPNGGQIYVDGFTGGQLPPKSSIREIRINQNPFSAQYDRLGYGRIEVFTKPGTDKLHGNFQMNGNPSQFNTSNPLTTTYQPPYHTLFMFGNLTGPLAKWASYNLGGSFRQIQDDQFTNATILAPSAGSSTLCIPGTAGFGTCVQTPYLVQTYFPQTRGDFSPRLDLALGDKNVLTMRYQFVKNDSTNASIGNLTLPTAAENTASLSNELQISDTQTYSSRLINETRFEYEREHVSDVAQNNGPTINVSGSFTGGGAGQQNFSDHQDHFEFQNYTSLQLKKNFLRFGGRLRTTREAENTGTNTNGSFTYAGLAAYQASTLSQFSITQVNNHKIGDTFADLGLYAETDWKPLSNLTVSYGLRYETQNHLPDHHDFAPRVSFNYGLFRGKGAPKTVLRGGFGLFYDRFGQGNILTLQQENGINETVYTVQNPVTGCVPSLSTPLTPSMISTCEGQVPASAQTIYSATSNLRTPYIVQFAAGADQQLGRAGTLSVNYLHSQGDHQLATQNINYLGAAVPGGGPRYQYFTEGVFNQNQLIINGRVQTSKNVSLFGYYSLNSAHGDTSGAGSFITTPGNIRADYGRTTFDVKSRLFVAGTVSLPHFIQFSPFVIAQTGNPYNITTGKDDNGDTIFNDRPVFGAANSNPAGTAGTNTIAGCGSFVDPTAGTSYTTIPINYCTGPGLFTFNFRLTKTIGFGGLKVAANSRQGGNQGGAGGPGGPPGGGGRGGGGGGRGGGPGGGPGGGMFGGGGASTGKRYNVAFGLQVQNLFDNKDLSNPQGSLASPKFGQSTQLAGGPYTGSSAVRRISLQASFNF